MPRRSDRRDPAPSEPVPPEPTFAIGHDGKIDGIYRPGDGRRAWTGKEAAQLELKAQKPRLESALPAPQVAPRASRKPAFAVAIIAAGLLLPFAAVYGYRAFKEAGAEKARASGLLVIDSVPSNARLFLDGQEVGRTPYVAPNTFEPGSTVQVLVRYPGAQDFTATVPGGVAASLSAELQSAELAK